MDGLLSDNGTWTELFNNSAVIFPNGEIPEKDCDEGSILSWKPEGTAERNSFGNLVCQKREKLLGSICTTSLCKKLNYQTVSLICFLSIGEPEFYVKLGCVSFFKIAFKFSVILKEP